MGARIIRSNGQESTKSNVEFGQRSTTVDGTEIPDENSRIGFTFEKTDISKAKPELGLITFGEANSKKWLDIGIPVIFKNSIVGTIELEQEMTGKKQKVKLKLSNGITVRSKNENEFVIFAVLRIISEEGLIFKGRYGRANYMETIHYLIKVVQKKIEKSNCYFLTIDDFYDFCLNDCMVLQCLLDAGFRDDGDGFRRFEPVIFKDDTKLLELSTYELSKEFKIFPGLEEKIIYNIGIVIEGKEIVVDLKKSIKKLINYQYSFFETPYSYYIEVE